MAFSVQIRENTGPCTCQLASNTSLNCWQTAIVMAATMLRQFSYRLIN